jgi:hypothetical protein
MAANSTTQVILLDEPQPVRMLVYEQLDDISSNQVCRSGFCHGRTSFEFPK